MSHDLLIRPIAHIRTDFPSKFGIPRQAGLAEALEGTVIFEPEFRVDEALRGIEGFSHLWLIWGFSENAEHDWSPTVRPPRLGGNTRMGVFATRSPFRPNGLGLSCVKLLSLRKDEALGTTLVVAGADMVDGTPIYDIKPYIPYADSHPGSAAGFVDRSSWKELQVIVPEGIELPQAAIEILRQDPRPQYHSDPSRIYGLAYGNKQIRFTVNRETLRVISFE
jgi:tRNA-Thr(GGU) m(6)t(6)A37 methyltransferase TsaA